MLSITVERIIPEDQALADRALAVSLQQITNISKITLRQLATAYLTVETNKDRLEEILKTGYPTDNIVYTNGVNCVKYPGNFYLIPLNPRVLLPALPLYLAAFDNHKEIFLIGYNRET